MFHEDAEKGYFLWEAPPEVRTEFERRLYEEVAEHPFQHLRPLSDVPGGMEYTCGITEAGNPDRFHHLFLRVKFQGEMRLFVLEFRAIPPSAIDC